VCRRRPNRPRHDRDVAVATKILPCRATGHIEQIAVDCVTQPPARCGEPSHAILGVDRATRNDRATDVTGKGLVNSWSVPLKSASARQPAVRIANCSRPERPYSSFQFFHKGRCRSKRTKAGRRKRVSHSRIVPAVTEVDARVKAPQVGCGSTKAGAGIRKSAARACPLMASPRAIVRSNALLIPA